MRRGSSCLAWLILFLFALTVAYADEIHADHVVIVKSSHTMTLYTDGKILREYKVALGRGPAEPKQKAGDHKTPEGHYVIDSRNARSKFHLALHISYPNAHDMTVAAQLHTAAGGMIEIHGLPNNFAWIGSQHRWIDWTDGCTAVTNPEIEEIWKLVPDGTPVDIHP